MIHCFKTLSCSVYYVILVLKSYFENDIGIKIVRKTFLFYFVKLKQSVSDLFIISILHLKPIAYPSVTKNA